MASSCSRRSWSTSLTSCAMRSSSFARMRARISGSRSVTLAENSSKPAQALFQCILQPASLAVAGAAQIRQSLAEQTLRSSDHRRGVARAVADDPGPAEQVQHVDSRRCACLRGNLLRPERETGQQFGIDFERGREPRWAEKCSEHSTLPRRQRPRSRLENPLRRNGIPPANDSQAREIGD